MRRNNHFNIIRTAIILLLIVLLQNDGVCRLPATFNNCFSFTDSSLATGKKIIITDQSLNRIIIVDAETNNIVWEWKPGESGVKSTDESWFGAPSEVKAVYNGKYILMTASKGAVALVRISDKRTVFYAYAGGNTHSAALLPDSNIVSASSTGNYLMVFHTDTSHSLDSVYATKIFLPFAHNAVWDKKRQVLWSAGRNQLYCFRYNFNRTKPNLTLVDSIKIEGIDAHDLFPDFNKDILWLTTTDHVFKVDPVTKKITVADNGQSKHVKSISTGPAGFPPIWMVPKEKWWTDEVTDENGKIVYKLPGLKIYKARWLLPDKFSEGVPNMK